jgi:hypothetical protein
MAGITAGWNPYSGEAKTDFFLDVRTDVCGIRLLLAELAGRHNERLETLCAELPLEFPGSS